MYVNRARLGTDAAIALLLALLEGRRAHGLRRKGGGEKAAA
jgi:hypothetical protein